VCVLGVCVCVPPDVHNVIGRSSFKESIPTPQQLSLTGTTMFKSRGLRATHDAYGGAEPPYRRDIANATECCERVTVNAVYKELMMHLGLQI